MNNDTIFQYNYSAARNKEVQAIRNKYLPKPENKLDELKRLDKCVHSAGMVQSLTIGIFGCLIFGLGMCFAVQVLGNSIAFGALLGACGILVMLLAYPMYRIRFKKAKAKYQPRILELAAELCGETNNN